MGQALYEQVAERLATIRLDGGERLHDLLVLARSSIGRQRPDVRPRGAERDVAVLDEPARRDGRRNSDAVLERRLVTLAGMGGPLEVQEDPHVRRLLQVELLDLQAV